MVWSAPRAPRLARSGIQILSDKAEALFDFGKFVGMSALAGERGPTLAASAASGLVQRILQDEKNDKEHKAQRQETAKATQVL